MRIKELHVENIKKIKVIDITPKENLVIVEGKNAQGKSSTLDSIAMLLGGQKLVPKQPLREGEEQGEIKAVVGDYVITRNWTTKDRSYLKIVSKDGMTPASPQKFLDDLIGNISFNPLKFIQMDKDAKINILKKITGLDLEDLRTLYAKIYDERRLANRDLDKAKKEIENYQDVEELVTVRKLELIQADIEKANTQNNRIEKAKEDIDDLQNENARLKTEITELETRTEQMRDEIVRNVTVIKDAEKVAVIDKIDTNIYFEELQKSESQQDIVIKLARKSELETEIKRYSNKTGKLNKRLQDIEKEKEERVKNTKMPIKGLIFTGKELTYNGIDIEQIALSEEIKVAMAIAMAENPKIKVILIHDGSLLDNDSMKEIKNVASVYDFQVWIERVSEKKGNEIFIEDGEIK